MNIICSIRYTVFSFLIMLFFANCSSVSKASNGVYKKNVHASYYADKFNGKRTASGATFNNNKLTAANRTLAFGTKVRVTNNANNKSVIVEINDRGPFVKGREIDLSKRAFMEITDNKNHGSLKVTIAIVK